MGTQATLLLNTLPFFWPKQVLGVPEQTLTPQEDLRPGGQSGRVILAWSKAESSPVVTGALIHRHGPHHPRQVVPRGHVYSGVQGPPN